MENNLTLPSKIDRELVLQRLACHKDSIELDHPVAIEVKQAITEQIRLLTMSHYSLSDFMSLASQIHHRISDTGLYQNHAMAEISIYELYLFLFLLIFQSFGIP
jgi:hypothetical protein